MIQLECRERLFPDFYPRIVKACGLIDKTVRAIKRTTIPFVGIRYK
jgi:hypothetical protein